MNYVHATMYDGDQDQKGEVTFKGESKADKFNCAGTIGVIAGALTAFNFPPMAQGVTGIANAVCAASTA